MVSVFISYSTLISCVALISLVLIFSHFVVMKKIIRDSKLKLYNINQELIKEQRQKLTYNHSISLQLKSEKEIHSKLTTTRIQLLETHYTLQEIFSSKKITVQT